MGVRLSLPFHSLSGSVLCVFGRGFKVQMGVVPQSVRDGTDLV
jgi:hypothetical protein